jgi:hypothetical protein
MPDYAVNSTTLADEAKPQLDALSEPELGQSFFDALAALAMIAEGATAPTEPIVRRTAHHGSIPQPLTPGSAQLQDGSVLNVMPTHERIVMLRQAWQSTTTHGQRIRVAGTAAKLLELERKGLPKRERYDKSEAMRRRIAAMPGSTREVADHFEDLSHMTVQRWRERYPREVATPYGTVEERVRPAVSLRS